jgi:mRNA interferase RelE/StbE
VDGRESGSSWMSYDLDFLDVALKEWRKLDPNTRQQFAKKLADRCENPHVPSAKLHGAANVYKIKLRSVGYRLVYEVMEKEIVVLVIAVGRRDKADFYQAAIKRSQ